MQPSFILMYTPQIFDPKFGVVKPEGSLGLIYLAAALRAENFEVSLLDATVGNDNYNLSETIYNEIPQSNGMVRVGMQTEDVLKEIESFDVVGISSIFSSLYIKNETIKPYITATDAASVGVKIPP